MEFAQRVAKALKQAVPCQRIGSMVLGMEVPHAHLHLVPIDAENELSFSNTPLQLSAEEMEGIRTSISDALDSAG
jgi:histidine triad (HIT) family protein